MRVAKTVLLAIGSIVGLVVTGIGVVYAASEWKLRRDYPPPAVAFDMGKLQPDAKEGRRMSKVLGCWAGCHGREGEGGSIDMDGYYSVSAPTLSSVLPGYSDEELVRLVRYGIKRDGSSALGMISYTFYPLSDADLANVIAHLRKQPTLAPRERHRSVTFMARWRLLAGGWQLAADQVDPARPRWGELPRTNAFERGRYLASVTCSECHGLDFRGNRFADNTYDGGPPLAVLAAYDDDAFRRLMRTGNGVGGRDLGEMGWVARNGFVNFTDREIADVYEFLRRDQGLPFAGPASGERE
ncbi:cytochrome c [Pseudoluteimonas lycopersici]|uniref:Cytochrome c n=1 Tax=Pseudoluteimonas lycopersici TaxID=1324796 RepID=A0A516V3U6_9GAMM|nr:cytochrome c [Lysobacter lycopersici]QDQ73201.1 cytochrome c [Lysobacter lycopersici]